MSTQDEWVHVRVPATSANLGPGFDALGLALDLVDDVAARPAPSGITVHVDGEGAAAIARDATNLVVRSLLTAAARIGLEVPGLELRATNRIPHGRGLGSSAAAICAGVLLADRLAGGRLGTSSALKIAAEIEGHPDNVGPCLLGGLTVAWPDTDGSALACRLELLDSIRPVALIPPHGSLTSLARAALPEVVPHRDAAANAGRAALLIAGLTQDPAVLLPATEDRLHQPYRAAEQPATAGLVARLRDSGVPAVVSGAGPSVLVLGRDEHEMSLARQHAPADWTVLEPGISARGAQ